MNQYALLADLIVVVHFCYVSFAVGGEVLILLGYFAGWRWIRRPVWRLAHLGAVLLVAVEAIIGILCPLTEWEYELRVRAGQRIEQEISFVARLVRAVIFYDFPAWVFTTVYIVFGLLVLLTLFLVPPRRPPKSGRSRYRT